MIWLRLLDASGFNTRRAAYRPVWCQTACAKLSITLVTPVLRIVDIVKDALPGSLDCRKITAKKLVFGSKSISIDGLVLEKVKMLGTEPLQGIRLLKDVTLM